MGAKGIAPRAGSATTTGRHRTSAAITEQGAMDTHPGAGDPDAGPTPATYISQTIPTRTWDTSVDSHTADYAPPGDGGVKTQLTLPDRQPRAEDRGTAAAKAAIGPMLTIAMRVWLQRHQEPLWRARWRSSVRRAGAPHDDRPTCLQSWTDPSMHPPQHPPPPCTGRNAVPSEIVLFSGLPEWESLLEHIVFWGIPWTSARH